MSEVEDQFAVAGLAEAVLLIAVFDHNFFAVFEQGFAAVARHC